MFRKYLIPVLAVAGIAFAINSVVVGSRELPPAPAVAPPARAPFTTYVAGAGIIETNTENIAIGTQVAGVVTQVVLAVGSHVKAGDPLFKLDDRNLVAELGVRQTALQVSQEKLERLKRLPRPEDVPPLEARVREAEQSLADLKTQLALWEAVTDKRAVSEEEMSRRRFAVQVAEARLEEARAQLTVLKAGAWKPDLQIAEAEVASARAQVQATQTDLERLTVRAPVDGQVLQVKVRAGEYATAGVLQTPLILLGGVEPLHLRVDVDENDAWRVHPGAAARGYVRGNRRIQTVLEFVRFEPYIVPKRSLTGDSTERVDTRVLQVIYRFKRGELPVYVGQQMDVFIEAPGLENEEQPPEREGSPREPPAPPAVPASTGAAR
jgi:HlyD family secretion protein